MRVRIGGPFDREKSLPTLRSLHKSGTKRTRKREEEKKRGVVRRKMAMKGGDGGSSLRAKTRSIDRLSIDDPIIQEEFVTFDGDCRPEGETLSLEQAARPTGEKKKKSFGCSPRMTSGGDFSTRIPLFSPRNNRLVLARPTRWGEGLLRRTKKKEERRAGQKVGRDGR